ncbi:MAG: ATP-binding protein [Byssovorax sp.]
MSARSLFLQISNSEQDAAWALLEEWVRSKKEESLHLEFKTAQGQSGQPETQDIKNFAKALSGFANTEGGVLAFGIKTKKTDSGADCANELPGVPHCRSFAASLDELRMDRTDPPVVGVQVHVAPQPGSDQAGVVLVYVPESHGGPHRVTNVKNDKDLNDKYYGRSGTITSALPHRHLAAMFAAQPAPALKLMIEQTAPYTVKLDLVNTGRGLARSARVRISFLDRGGSAIPGANPQPARDWLQRPSVGMGGDKYPLVLDAVSLLYPEDTVPLCVVTFAATSGRTGGFDHASGMIKARIDAEAMQPVVVIGSVPPYYNGGAPVIYPRDDS